MTTEVFRHNVVNKPLTGRQMSKHRSTPEVFSSMTTIDTHITQVHTALARIDTVLAQLDAIAPTPSTPTPSTRKRRPHLPAWEALLFAAGAVIGASLAVVFV